MHQVRNDNLAVLAVKRLLLPGIRRYEQSCTAWYLYIAHESVSILRIFDDPKENKKRPWCTLHCNGLDSILLSPASPHAFRGDNRM
jgi:hypothetical protein